jgi:GT2 family glycosyltransferase
VTSQEHAVQASVVICTRNRGAKIGTAVASVLGQDHPSYDVTVIDQSTDDETEVVVKELMASDPRLRYVHSAEAGLSKAYNTAIRSTSGEILAFTDDDCVAPPDWLSKIAAAFAAEPDGMLLYGQVSPFGERREDAELTPALAITKAERLSRKDGYRVFGMGANFAARRSLFDGIGPFDEVLGGGAPLRSSQDYDLAYRAFRSGYVTLLRPEVEIRHDGRRERADWPALLLAYGTGDGAFYTKHVRCRDPYALWLLTRLLGVGTAKWLAKLVLLRHPNNWNYLRGVWSGIRGSFRFAVDRQRRLYRAPS